VQTCLQLALLILHELIMIHPLLLLTKAWKHKIITGASWWYVLIL
jgi:hypothetical protein